jgi:hypothetical protein
MDALSNQVNWLEPFMYYFLFDLAIFGVLIIGYLSIKVVALLLSKQSKNQYKYH